MIIKLFTVALSMLAAPLWAMEMESVYGNNSDYNNPGQHSPLLSSHARVGTRSDGSSFLQDRSAASMQSQPYSVGNNNNNTSNSLAPLPVRSSRTRVGNYTGFQDPTRGLLVKNYMNEMESLGKKAKNLVGINYRDKDGNTSLHVAVAYIADNFSSLEFCKDLIADGADVTVLNNQGQSPLDLARKYGERDVACYLQNQTDELLGRAAQHGSIEWIVKSVAAGADVNAQNSFGETPLARAAFHGHLDICTVLTGYGAQLDSAQPEILSSLSITRLNHQVNTVQLLNLYGNNQLITAIQRGNLEWVKRCIDRDVDLNKPNTFGVLPLHEAVVQKRTVMCRLFLARGADITAQDAQRKTPLDLVDDSTPEELKRVLQEHLDDLLIDAVVRGEELRVERLIAAGARANAISSISADSALLLAAYHRHQGIVRALLKKDADVDYQNPQGDTPLLAAAFVGDEQVADILLKKRAGKKPADIDHQNLVKSTALIVAASKGFEKLARLLVEKGANTELHDESNETALIHAESRGFAAIAHLLNAKSRATDNWISANTKKCPKCDCRWMKDPSCDKMTCGRLTKQLRYDGCGAQWCWQCGNDWRLTCNHHVYTEPIVSAAREQLTYKNLSRTALNIVIAGGIGYIGSKLAAMSWVAFKLVNNNTLKLGLKDPNIPAIHAQLTAHSNPNGSRLVYVPEGHEVNLPQDFIRAPLHRNVGTEPVATTPGATTCYYTSPAATNPVTTQPVVIAPVAQSVGSNTNSGNFDNQRQASIEALPLRVEQSAPSTPATAPRKLPSNIGVHATNTFSWISLDKLFTMDARKFSKWEIHPEFANAIGCLFSYDHKKFPLDGTCYSTIHKNFNITWTDYLVKMAMAQTVMPGLDFPEWVKEFISTAETNIDWAEYTTRMAHIGQPIPQWVMDII